MLTGLRSKLQLIANQNPTQISAQIYVRFSSQHLANAPFPLSSLSTRYLFDEMSQRAAFVFRSLKFLKHATLSAKILASFHSFYLKTGALSHASVRTSLLSAYARAFDLDSSLVLFRESDEHDLISWNAVVNAFFVNSCFVCAVVLFEEMVRVFGNFDSTTLVIVLSAISAARDLSYGVVLHGTIVKRRLDWDICLCNALIDMYAKCGELRSSETLFESMEIKDVASWNSIINGCLYNGWLEISALYFREMSCFGIEADQISMSCVLAVCSCLEELFCFGKSVHGLVIKLGWKGNTSVANALISFYSQNGDVEDARNVFRELIVKNVVSWNSMLHGIIDNDSVHKALDLFLEMQSGFATQPDAVTLLTIIPVCGRLKLISHGKSIHGYAIRNQVESISVSNSLLEMYLQCDDITLANLLFSLLHNKDLITWNTIISRYSQIDSLKEDAWSLFRQLQQTGLRCNLASLLVILPSCNSPKDLRFGRGLHSWELKYGFGNIVSAVNALMFMYINCGDLGASSLLLESIQCVSDVVSWNTIIVGCNQNGHYNDALEAFESMHHSANLHPDPITFVSIISSCGNLESLFHGRLFHGLVLKNSIGSDLRVTNALLTMYLRCKDTESALLVFDASNNMNLCSWNCMISGLTRNEEGRKALEFFRCMETIPPNEMTLVGVMCACTQLGNLRHGMEVHGYIFRFQHLNNTFISSALINMYSKCGRLDIATQVFESCEEKSIASWNAMILACGFHGHGTKAIELFSELSSSGAKATKSTFISLLSACSYCGLIDEGWKYYKLMSEKFGIQPSAEHHVCIVDMLGRAGQHTEALEFVNKLPTVAESGVWGALLSACSDHGDVEMGKSIAADLFGMDDENTGYYVTLSNLYASRGMWSSASSVRRLIEDRKLKKSPGCSSIDVRR